MKTTLVLLFVGLALWFGLAVGVGVMFQREPARVAKPAVQQVPVAVELPART